MVISKYNLGITIFFENFMVEYFIIDKKINLKDISSYRDKANKISVEDCLLIANMFDISLSKKSSITDMKIKEEDYLYLDDPSKIKIKNMIKSKFLKAINDVMLPLVNVDFSQPMPTGKNIFYIPLDDKVVVGSAKTSIYSGYSFKPDLADDISSVILIKKFLLY